MLFFQIPFDIRAYFFITMKSAKFITLLAVAIFTCFASVARTVDEVEEVQTDVSVINACDTSIVNVATDFQTLALPNIPESLKLSDTRVYEGLGTSVRLPIYVLPVSWTGTSPDWHRLWINTAVLSGAFVGTLLVLECLPEDATSWNRAEIRNVPLFKRWYNHVFEKGPEWDHDKFVFNYVLHPYAGAVYFMSARSNGFNFWQSMLYSAIISDVGWEFGIEAFMERPSYQDMVVTPVIGSLIGEGFYRLKRHLVMNDYRLFGSPVVGNIVAFLIDPVNEVVGLFNHNPARSVAKALRYDPVSQDVVEVHRDHGDGVSMSPFVMGGYSGFSLTATF